MYPTPPPTPPMGPAGLSRLNGLGCALPEPGRLKNVPGAGGVAPLVPPPPLSVEVAPPNRSPPATGGATTTTAAAVGVLAEEVPLAVQVMLQVPTPRGGLPPKVAAAWAPTLTGVVAAAAP